MNGKEKMMQKVFQYIENNRERYIRELKEFIKYPSVSKHSPRKQDTRDCAQWLVTHFNQMGLKAQLIETAGHPIVRAEGKGKSSKRLIIYGHYDVQPAEPLDLWNTPPFEATEKDGFLYARGATDDKGQLFCHIKGIESLLKTEGELPCDVLFLIEGEEEGAGTGIKDYIIKEKAELTGEAIVVSDGNMWGDDTPAICYGLRGIISMELIIKGPKTDLHSGSFGGTVPNPAMALAKILAQCVDDNGKILVPGIYDKVRPTADWEAENFRKLAFNEKAFLEQTGIKALYGEEGYSALERVWNRPTFEINGIYGGYAGEGGKTIVPSYAGAKITLRLVPDQDANEICKSLKAFIQSLIPAYVDYELRGPSGSNPVYVDIHQPALQAGKNALKEGFGKEPVYIREGGSISVVKVMWEELHLPIILMGFGSDKDGAHAPNEKFSLSNFMNGIKTSASLLKEFK
jgi:acetylornithine deacetylase/succinyl-diaminopimelate desuccinylase-like protein